MVVTTGGDFSISGIACLPQEGIRVFLGVNGLSRRTGVDMVFIAISPTRSRITVLLRACDKRGCPEDKSNDQYGNNDVYPCSHTELV